jgi:aryl-alcohol dehydrogenase-like predicted oxidoreductase
MGARAALRLPAVGIGCWAFGGGSYWGAQEQEDVDRVVARALEVGLNYFDTAESYNGGESETSLGKALGSRRGDALIGTKVSPSNASPDRLRQHCEESLRRLRTDYVDIYMIHWPLNGQSVRHFTADEQLIRNPPELGAALLEMERLRQEGKIRFIGVSNFGLEQLAEATGFGVPVSVNEIAYNLLMRAAECTVLPFCAAQRMAAIGYSALMQGLLARPLDAIDGVAPVRLRTRHFASTREGSRHGEPGIESETLAAIRAVAQIARQIGRPVAEVALAWSVANEGIDCTLVGCRNVEQLEENLRSLAHPLAPEIKEALDRASLTVKQRLGERIDYFQSEHETRSW